MNLDNYNIKENENMNKMMTFAEYVAMREGLWLNDKNAVVGLSKIAPPTPPKKTKPPTPPKIKPPHVPKTCEGSLDQFHQSVDELGKLGIGLLPPKEDDLKRLIDKQKNQITVPQRTHAQPRPLTVPTKAPGSPPGRSATVDTAWGSAWPSPPCSRPTGDHLRSEHPGSGGSEDKFSQGGNDANTPDRHRPGRPLVGRSGG